MLHSVARKAFTIVKVAHDAEVVRLERFVVRATMMQAKVVTKLVHKRDGPQQGRTDGLAVMGQRLITTGAVRCVGNTLLLYGRTYSPPFRVTAVGDPTRLRTALGNEPGVRLFGNQMPLPYNDETVLGQSGLGQAHMLRFAPL